MTYEDAARALKERAEKEPCRIHFLMGKDNDFEVITGWNGRDRAIAQGFVFPRYSISRGAWITDFVDNCSSGPYCD